LSATVIHKYLQLHHPTAVEDLVGETLKRS